MTRFERELSGELGPFWVEHAQKELDATRQALINGEITIDAAGIARNDIGRIVMSDVLEKLAMISDKVDVRATQEAHTAEVHAEIESYRENKRTLAQEEIFEMRAAFGSGSTVVDVLTGETIAL